MVIKTVFTIFTTVLAISKEDEAKYTIRRIHIKAMIKSIVLANFFIAFPHIVFDTDTYILPQHGKIIKYKITEAGFALMA